MRTVVVKVGGVLLNGPLDVLWEQLEALQQTAEVVLVHGGGPQTTNMAVRLGHEPAIVEGRRITGDLDLAILNWVIRGDLSLKLVASAAVHGIKAVGLSGADAGIIGVIRREPWNIDGREVDFGHVGDFVSSDLTALLALTNAGVIPLVCPPGIDTQGNLLNINADTIALELACALGAAEMILVTEVGAVLGPGKEPVRRLTRQDADTGVEHGWIEGGMKVKTDIGFEALGRGVKSVWVTSIASLSGKSKATQLRENDHV
jgi:acetylglutamate kinase